MAINIQTHINDTMVEIHKTSRDMQRPAAPTPMRYTLEEQEEQLGALDLLLTGGETIQQYRKSHKYRRLSTVRKRLKVMGDTVDHLPPVGTSIRTYAQGCCTKTVLHKYNTQTSECVLAIPKSDMTLTTTIENMNRNAVRKNRLTSYETSIVKHSVEWLEHSESGEDIWKYYGTISHIMELEGETHVLIIRASDAKHEYQPLQDVIEGDTIRLGKEIGNSGRGRRASRGKHLLRGHAPSRVRTIGSDSQSLKEKNCTGDNQSPKSSFAGGQKITASQFTVSSSARGIRIRAQTQPSEPGSHEADGVWNGAHPGKTNPAYHSREHRRPALKVVGGRQTGDVAAPDD